MSSSSLPVNNGTVGVQLVPHTEPSSSGGSQIPGSDQYHTISAQQECAEFSLEELRLADYEQGHGPSSVGTSRSSAKTSASPLQRLSRSDAKKHDSHLNLLRGPGIELHVGTATSVHDSTEDSMCNTWSLPKRLVSQYSPFLEAACLRNFKERRENRIQLPDDDPLVFALFVEWMYYGEYAIAPFWFPVHVGSNSISVHAKCWVLGDKLLCTEFKNHAMSRLYAQHNVNIFSSAISTLDVQYACDNSAENSKLRKLYMDLVATNFEKQDRVLGTVDEWDQLFSRYADVRRLLLHSFRLEAAKRSFVKSEDCYLEGDDAPLG